MAGRNSVEKPGASAEGLNPFLSRCDKLAGGTKKMLLSTTSAVVGLVLGIEERGHTLPSYYLPEGQRGRR